MKRTQGSSRTRTSPRIIPANGGMSSRPRPLAGRAQDTQILPAVTDLTQELPRVNPSALPAVYQHTPPVPATALAGTLPLPHGYLPAPPSAQHADPARWYDRTHVEDNDLEPQARGRHALDELKAADAETDMPDLVGHDEPAPAIRGAYGRIVAALAAPRPESLADAVRIARQAYRISKGNRRWFVEEETKLDACWRRIAEFNADWDRQVRDTEIARHGRRAVVAAEELTAAYEENRLRIEQENARRAADGRPLLDVTATTFTKGMQAKVKALLVEEALKEPLAGSAVSA